MINLHYGDHALFCGMTGCGKTTLMQELVKKNMYPIVIVFKKLNVEKRMKKGEPLWSSFCTPLTNIKDIVRYIERNKDKPIKIMYTPEMIGEEALVLEHEKICKFAYEAGGILLINDEVTEVSNPHKIYKYHQTILHEGRGIGTSYWAGSQRPQGINNWIWTQSKHKFLFNMDAKDVDVLKKYFAFWYELIQLPDFEFIYYNGREKYNFESNKDVSDITKTGG